MLVLSDFAGFENRIRHLSDQDILQIPAPGQTQIEISPQGKEQLVKAWRCLRRYQSM